MPFVKRNNDKQIIGIFCEKQKEAQEELPINDKEIINFLQNDDYSNYTSHMMNRSDSEFIRVLEDLIDVLLEKHIILLTDLPEIAQQKLLNRKQLRKKHTQSILSGDDDDIF